MTDRRQRRGFLRRVEGAVRQLLAIDTGGNPIEQPDDPLPLGVVARLTLLHAARTDSRLLLSESQQSDRREKRLGLIRASARVVRDWTPAESRDFLDADVELPVRCSKSVHRLCLDAFGAVHLPAHPQLDRAAERVAVALGAPALPCLAAAEGVPLSYAPPVSDDGMRLRPMDAGELGAFVHAVRAWLSRGYDVAAAAPALELGIAPDDVGEHLAHGFSVEDAVSWRTSSTAEVLRWRELGIDALGAESWLGQSRALAELEEHRVAPNEGAWMIRWARLVGSRIPTDAVIEWARFGVPVGVWGEIASRGVRATEAAEWVAAGFSSVEVLRYAHLRVPLAEALRWQAEGFTGFVAAGCLGVGMKLEDACALRGLPTREVQDAWRDLRSVEGVREVVEAR